MCGRIDTSDEIISPLFGLCVCHYVSVCVVGGGGGGGACDPHIKLVTSMPPNVTRVTTEEEIRCQNNI